MSVTKTFYVAATSPRALDGNPLWASREECEAHNQSRGHDWPIFTLEVTVSL
jgi:hypothetical protein